MLLTHFSREGAAAALKNFAKETATGYFQLYFLLIIMQFYLVCPLRGGRLLPGRKGRHDRSRLR